MTANSPPYLENLQNMEVICIKDKQSQTLVEVVRSDFHQEYVIATEASLACVELNFDWYRGDWMFQREDEGMGREVSTGSVESRK